MTTLHIRGQVRRLGNSLVVVIPADMARKANLREGSDIVADVTPGQPEILGLFKDLPYTPFTRDDLYDDD